MSSAGVFVCYQFRERELAERLQSAFSLSNAPLDRYDTRMREKVTTDGAIKSEVARALETAACVVCLVGPTTATSSWVDWELAQSQRLGKPLLVVRPDPNDPLPEAMAGAAITFSTDVEDAMTAIRTLVDAT